VVDAIDGFGLERHRPRPAPHSDWKPLRCHELARVVYEVLTGIEHAVPRALVEGGLAMHLVDGHYGSSQHSWIGLVDGVERGILDCYAVGQLPPVQLVHDTMGLSRMYRADVCGALRSDIRRADVVELVQLVSARVFAPGQERREDANVCGCGHALAVHSGKLAFAATMNACTLCGCLAWHSPRSPI
jgi:hypothetical protein